MKSTEEFGVVCAVCASWQCEHAVDQKMPEGVRAWYVEVRSEESWRMVVYAAQKSEAEEAAEEAVTSSGWESDEDTLTSWARPLLLTTRPEV